MIKRRNIAKMFFILMLLGVLINIDMVFANDPFEIVTTDDDATNNTDEIPPGGGSGSGSGNGGKPTETWEFSTEDKRIKTTCTTLKTVKNYSNVYGKAYNNKGQQVNIKKLNQDYLAGTYIELNIYENKGYTKKTKYETKSYEVEYKCTYKYEYYATSCNLSTTGDSIVASPLILNPSNTGKTGVSQLKADVRPCIIDGAGNTYCPPPRPNPPGTDPEPSPKPSPTQKCTYTSEKLQSEKCSEQIVENGKTLKLSQEEEIDKERKKEDILSEEIEWCQGIAKRRTSHTDLYPSYIVTYKDSNDIAETAGTTFTHEGSGDCLTEDGDLIGGITGYVQKTKKCTFNYNREKTCINVKNGKVRYISTNSQCDSNNEYTITMKDGYWKYFIPLNTKSADGFTIAMNPNGASKQSVAACQSAIDRHDDYKNLIKPAGNYSFSASDTKAQAKRTIERAGGCYYQTTITIPIVQRFYNEVNNGNNFKGFNFYYRPIDINNPFPNPLPKESLWYEWNNTNDKNKKPNIEESYEEATYIANITNVDKIRKYNKENPYTSWANMSTSGTSNFIDKTGFVIRKVERNSYYKLGCGPSNTNVTNAFYQQECDR